MRRAGDGHCSRAATLRSGACACAIDSKLSYTSRHSSRSRPLKLSMNAFSTGLPGRMKSSATPRRYAHSSRALDVNSVPWSTVIAFGSGRRRADSAIQRL